ncbi:hypothetical protein HZA56_14030 [Candidatus Poribacteria bacterium]|nr:hypothetical protein [Candidatus Poribacteria bacterium]
MAFLGIPTSRKDLGNAGWIKGAATVGARTTANLGSLTGGSQASVQKLRGFADAIDDPNQGYAGTLNPAKALTSINAPGTAFNFTQARPVAGGAAGGQVQGDSTFDPNGTGLGGGAYGSGSGAAYDPDLDPTKIAAQRGQIRNLMSMFEQAYNDVVGQVDRLAAQKRGDFEKSYGDQQVGLDKNFGSTTQGIDDQFSARNAYHSSYRENAQQQARDAYDSATGQLGEAKNRDIASVGQFADQQKAEFAGSRPTFNVDDYGKVSDLLDIGQTVQSALNKIKTTGAGLGTDSQYIQHLNGIAPTQETGSAALKAQLDKLAQTGTNPDAKRAIAAVTIQNAGGDQSAWMDYFEKQQTQTGSNAVTDPTMVALQ